MTARISRDTQLCMSLSGRPGNFGTRFQNHLYEALGLDYVYKAFTTTDLPAAIGGIRALGIRGCAISMPFKEAVIPLLDGLEASAARIASVNTIVNSEGDLRGYNTDYIALVELLRNARLPPATPWILRGSGGMAKAAAHALIDGGLKDGIVVARNAERGPALAAQVGVRWQAELPKLGGALLVNVTPIGMAGGPEADTVAFPDDLIEHARCVFDVVAIPVQTPLIRRATALARPTITGREVIILQAVEQFVLYTGVRPSAGQIEAAADFASS